jgi:hypothetical protein
MERLKQIWVRIVNYLFPEWGRPVVSAQPPQASPAKSAITASPKPAMYAYKQLFASSHADQEKVVFRPVDCSGEVIERSEEWYRDGDTLRSEINHTMVVTPSGAIANPKELKIQCSICLGYENETVHCQNCGRALCRIHRVVFEQPDGTGKMTLCPICYQRFWETLNVWETRDRQRIKGGDRV